MSSQLKKSLTSSFHGVPGTGHKKRKSKGGKGLNASHVRSRSENTLAHQAPKTARIKTGRRNDMSGLKSHESVRSFIKNKDRSFDSDSWKV